MAADQVALVLSDGIPRLQLGGSAAPGPVSVGFEGGRLAHRRRAGHNELLGRAVGWRAAGAPRVVDATAGFGRDAFLLADLGCEVLLLERHPLMAWMLELALERARNGDDPWLLAVSARMRLRSVDATLLGDADIGHADVIYLDPMFREQRRAAPGKEMQLLHVLLGAGESCREAHNEALFDWSMERRVRRVVVKRPLRAPPLGRLRPGHSIRGRAVRFDVYPRPVEDGQCKQEERRE